MDLPLGYELRTPQEEEIEAITAVVVADELDHTGHVTLGGDFVNGEWSQPGFDSCTDAWVVTDGGATVVAYGHTRREELQVVFSWAAVHPQHRGLGIGTALFSHIASRAAAMLAAQPVRTLRHAAYAHDRGAAAILSAAGLERVRHFWHMQIDFDGPVGPGDVPQGYEITTVDSPEDLQATFEVINEALAENWDYHTTTFERWLGEEIATPGHDPGLWLLATRDGVAVGALTASLGEGRGWIDYLGVREEHRGRGVAAALLRHGFAGFSARGAKAGLVSVDAANAARATAVYQRAGMREVKAWDMWQANLRR